MIEVIPAIDLMNGKCVRLTQGDYKRKTVYTTDPLEVALSYEAIGIRRLHLVDLEGARCGRVVHYQVLERIASKTRLKVDFGGGIKTNEDIRSVFQAGAAIATVGSVAIKDKALLLSWLRTYGTDKILLGADVQDEKIRIHGWAESTDILLNNFIKEYLVEGIQTFFCTDISKDGLLQGPSLALYKKIVDRFPMMNLIASGGISHISDIQDLEKIGCSGVFIGKALSEGRIKLPDLKIVLYAG